MRVLLAIVSLCVFALAADPGLDAFFKVSQTCSGPHNGLIKKDQLARMFEVYVSISYLFYTPREDRTLL